MDEKGLPWKVTIRMIGTPAVILDILKIKIGTLKWVHDIAKFLSTGELLGDKGK